MSAPATAEGLFAPVLRLRLMKSEIVAKAHCDTPCPARQAQAGLMLVHRIGPQAEEPMGGTGVEPTIRPAWPTSTRLFSPRPSSQASP